MSVTTARPVLTARTQPDVGCICTLRKSVVSAKTLKKREGGSRATWENRSVDTYTYTHTSHYIHINLCGPPPNGTQ